MAAAAPTATAPVAAAATSPEETSLLFPLANALGSSSSFKISPISPTFGPLPAFFFSLVLLVFVVDDVDTDELLRLEKKLNLVFFVLLESDAKDGLGEFGRGRAALISFSVVAVTN
jgi:hypothetical protein